ncbi:MAG: type II toxin-antitoxin system RelE/ParE family toxin [Chthonomonas sp.]|nr:type II toxin-antitoxin system RelE/ParE family toxin [Chthonomonas sp.]
MGYSVVITERAKHDIDEAIRHIATDSLPAATRWNDKFIATTEILADTPFQFSLISEVHKLKREYRSANLHSHRVIFRVLEENQTVLILRVYHGSRRPLTSIDLEPEY